MLGIVCFPKVDFGLGGCKGIYIGGGKEGYEAAAWCGFGQALKKSRKALNLIFLELAFVELDGVLVAEVEGVADEGVTDGDLVEAGDIEGEEVKVLEIEIVSGVE